MAHVVFSVISTKIGKTKNIILFKYMDACAGYHWTQNTLTDEQYITIVWVITYYNNIYHNIFVGGKTFSECVINLYIIGVCRVFQVYVPTTRRTII